MHLSEVPGAADHLQGGLVVYTKTNKSHAFGVPANLLNSRGVCPEVARAMAEGAPALTGVAGPDPDEDGNPVGLVCIAVVPRVGQNPEVIEKRYGMAAPRERIQEWATAEALATLLRIAAPKEAGTHGMAAD